VCLVVAGLDALGERRSSHVDVWHLRLMRMVALPLPYVEGALDIALGRVDAILAVGEGIYLRAIVNPLAHLWLVVIKGDIDFAGAAGDAVGVTWDIVKQSVEIPPHLDGNLRAEGDRP